MALTRSCGVHNSWDLAVRVDGEEIRRMLFVLEDVYSVWVVGNTHLFKSNANLQVGTNKRSQGDIV